MKILKNICTLILIIGCATSLNAASTKSGKGDSSATIGWGHTGKSGKGSSATKTTTTIISAFESKTTGGKGTGKGTSSVDDGPETYGWKHGKGGTKKRARSTSPNAHKVTKAEWENSATQESDPDDDSTLSDDEKEIDLKDQPDKGPIETASCRSKVSHALSSGIRKMAYGTQKLFSIASFAALGHSFSSQHFTNDQDKIVLGSVLGGIAGGIIGGAEHMTSLNNTSLVAAMMLLTAVTIQNFTGIEDCTSLLTSVAYGTGTIIQKSTSTMIPYQTWNTLVSENMQNNFNLVVTKLVAVLCFLGNQAAEQARIAFKPETSLDTKVLAAGILVPFLSPILKLGKKTFNGIRTFVTNPKYVIPTLLAIIVMQMSELYCRELALNTQQGLLNGTIIERDMLNQTVATLNHSLSGALTSLGNNVTALVDCQASNDMLTTNISTLLNPVKSGGILSYFSFGK